MGGYIRTKPYVSMSDDELNKRSEELKDLFTPNANHHDELTELLEIERELTLREDQ